MKDIGTTGRRPGQTAAEQAVERLLLRVEADPHLAYHLFMTETLDLAMKAHAEAIGIDPAEFKADFQVGVRTEAPHCSKCGDKA